MKLLIDFLPVVLFFVVYKLADIYAATAAAIAVAALQVGGSWWRRRQLEQGPLLTLALLLVFGGLTLALRDPLFVMWKPTLINWLFAAAFFASHWFGHKPLAERLLGAAIQVPRAIWRRVNLAWSGFFFFLGLANLYVVYWGSGFFTARRALIAASGQHEIDLAHCAAQFSGSVLALCEAARVGEEIWVNFKLFGMMGLTLIFVVAQAWYLARHGSAAGESQEH